MNFYMSNSNLKNLLLEYEKKRLNAIHDAEQRKLELYKQLPELQEVDDKLSLESIKISKQLLISNNSELLNNLNEKIEKLKSRKEELLKGIGKDLNYLNPKYECSICLDTGYIASNYQSNMCNCLKQKLFDIEYNKTNISNLDKQNFNCFDSTLYSEAVDIKKYHNNISPRKNINLIKDICLKFIENFDDANEKNLLFTGNTGLGKTFLSSCIANELLKKGKTILYQTAPLMLDAIIDYRFGKNNTSKNLYDNLLSVDLLIIDDLGAEFMNAMKSSELFNIINTRLLNSDKKVIKTIISTNLSLDNLFSVYDERIGSRLVGNYNICYFYGDDIRFKKNKLDFKNTLTF